MFMEFEETSELVAKTPVWAPGAETPPLSPRRAQKIASKQMKELVKDRKVWRFQQIDLIDMGDHLHWIYVVRFSRAYYGPHIAVFRGEYLHPVVLMDGTVVKPTHIKPIP